MSECRYDREFDEYLTPDGKPCLRDEHGDPTRHCTARRTCSQHVGFRELTCGRCLGRVRRDLRMITELVSLMPYEALADGVQSEAANIAGPSTDVRQWSARRVAMGSHLLTWESCGRITEQQYLHARALMEDDDDLDPDALLNRWHMMLAEDYGHALPSRMTLGTAWRYLDGILTRMAQDEAQDFPRFRREMRDLRTHLDAVLRNSQARERGAPCPTCRERGVFVRLSREYGHWCLDPDCDRIHFLDESGDVWRCPVNREHWWNPQGYADLLEERHSA